MNQILNFKCYRKQSDRYIYIYHDSQNKANQDRKIFRTILVCYLFIFSEKQKQVRIQIQKTHMT